MWVPSPMVNGFVHLKCLSVIIVVNELVDMAFAVFDGQLIRVPFTKETVLMFSAGKGYAILLFIIDYIRSQ